MKTWHGRSGKPNGRGNCRWETWVRPQIQSGKSNFWPAAEEKSTQAHDLKLRWSSTPDRTTASKEKSGQEHREWDLTSTVEKSRAGRNQISTLRLVGKMIWQENMSLGTVQATGMNMNQRTSWVGHCCALGALERKMKIEKHTEEPAMDD
jgi:hypothetical protein